MSGVSGMVAGERGCHPGRARRASRGGRLGGVAWRVGVLRVVTLGGDSFVLPLRFALFLLFFVLWSCPPLVADRRRVPAAALSRARAATRTRKLDAVPRVAPADARALSAPPRAAVVLPRASEARSQLHGTGRYTGICSCERTVPYRFEVKFNYISFAVGTQAFRRNGSPQGATGRPLPRHRPSFWLVKRG